MSEAERLRRQEYKKNRKKWILIQAAALALLIAIALSFFAIYDKVSRTYYIEYTESGTLDYKVHLKDNSFFDEDFLEKDRSYISSLIKNITADFTYALDMNAASIGFDYSYKIDAQMVVANKDSGDYILAPTYEIIPRTVETSENTNSLAIKKSVEIDYNKYNDIATSFIKAYDLKNTTSTLIVTLTVDVLGHCEEFEENSANSYFISLNIPLVEENFSIFSTSTTPDAESNVLACNDAENQKVFFIIAIVASVLAFLLAVLLIVFIYITRNEDINYTNKVRKLVSAYRSFIQQIDGQFDVTGYQIVRIKTFNEMLGIRDTLQAPILMFENSDQTMTEFVIPTNTKILYIFEIKVDNYDEIYGTVDIDDSDDTDAFEEAVIIDSEVSAEDIAEAMASPDVILADIDYVEDNDEDCEGTEENPGVEVVGVVWPERAHKNKVYRYDPDGEQLDEGDMVLVPTRDAARDREVIRKAAIAHGNHKIDPALHPHAFKKIIGVIKRRAEAALAPDKEKTNE